MRKYGQWLDLESLQSTGMVIYSHQQGLKTSGIFLSLGLSCQLLVFTVAKTHR